VVIGLQTSHKEGINKLMKSTNNFPNYQATYARTAGDICGEYMDYDKWQTGQEQRKYLLDQTHFIAKQLECEGIEAYNSDQDLHIFGLHSKSYRELPNFRNICFLPSVAQKNRAQTLKSLEFFLQTQPNARAWTITTGTRVGLRDLGERVRKLHRKISKINATAWMKRAGARFVFRSTELGEVFPDNDDVSCHPHVHALMVLQRFIPRDEWSNLLSKIQAFFGAYSQDNGKLRNVREMVKYCVKPSDFLHLDSKHVASLYHATKGLRLVESLRDLRATKRNLRENRHKLVRRKGVLKKVPTWVGGAPLDKVIDSVPRWMEASTTESIERDEIFGRGLQLTPKIVAWCSPASVFTPVKEPIFLVHGLTKSGWSKDASGKIFEWEEVRRMEDLIKVHTKTLTVQEKENKIQEIENKYYENKQKIPIGAT
jgi:hypothetical protein